MQIEKNMPCPDCGSGAPRTTSDVGSYCRLCKSARCQAYRRGATLARRGPLSPEAYQQMLMRQVGLCAICRDRPARVLDHNHDTGAIRGILCSTCNRALGMFGDSAALLDQARDYLQ